MADFKTDMNVLQTNYELNTLIDEVSDNEVYNGITNNFKIGSASSWQIKKTWKVGTVWHTGYPNGDQSFSFVWDNRATYTTNNFINLKL